MSFDTKFTRQGFANAWAAERFNMVSQSRKSKDANLVFYFLHSSGYDIIIYFRAIQRFLATSFKNCNVIMT